MPQVHDVVLNYEPGNASAPFGPTPRQVQVGPGDTIRFRLGQATSDAKPGSKLRITLNNSQHFSARELKQAGTEDLVLRVTAPSAAALAAAGNTTYKCELLNAQGSPIASADGPSGGEIVPGSGVAGADA